MDSIVDHVPASRWLAVRPTPMPPRVRLLCFPPAGGGASIFRQWGRELPADVMLCPVQLPGREERLADPPVGKLATIVRELSAAVTPLLDLPIVLFGHSMGALIAFEFTRHLRRSLREPAHLIVSAFASPRVTSARASGAQQDEAAFVADVERFTGLAPETIGTESFRRFALPCLRADFAVCDEYRYVDDEPLACPITCLIGGADAIVDAVDMAGWRDETHGKCHVQPVPGDHRSVLTPPSRLIEIVADICRSVRE